MKWIKKYWWILLITFVSIAAPLIINWLILTPKKFAFVGDGTHWLGFWATYISAIASFAMVFITWFTLKHSKKQNELILQQNKEQLAELKRQWNEQNRPYLSCILIKGINCLYVRVVNSSNVIGNDISVSISNNSNLKLFNFENTQQKLKNMKFVIEPRGYKDITILATPYIDGEYDGFLTVNISIRDVLFGSYDLYFKEINIIASPLDISNAAALNDIKDAISKIKLQL